MERPETTGADISTADNSEALISLLDEYIDHLENLISAYEIAGKGLVAQSNIISSHVIYNK